MKKLLFLILTILLVASAMAQKTGPITPVYIRTDSITPYTDNEDLNLSGRGTGGVKIEGAYTLPKVDGATGQVMMFNGDGTTQPGDVTGYSVSSEANDRIVTSTGAATGNAETNLTFNGTTLHIGPNSNYSELGTRLFLFSGTTLKLNLRRDGLRNSGAELLGLNNATSAALSIYGYIQTLDDTGTIPVTILTSSLNNSSVLSTRPTLAGYNYDTKQWEVAADGTWDYEGSILSDVADPINAQDVATKNYVDEITGVYRVTETGVTTSGNVDITVPAEDGVFECWFGVTDGGNAGFNKRYIIRKDAGVAQTSANIEISGTPTGFSFGNPSFLNSTTFRWPYTITSSSFTIWVTYKKISG